MQAVAKMAGAHWTTSSEADRSMTSGARAMVMQGMKTWTDVRPTTTTRATLDERVPVRGMVDWSTICAEETELDRWSGTQARLACRRQGHATAASAQHAGAAGECAGSCVLGAATGWRPVLRRGRSLSRARTRNVCAKVECSLVEQRQRPTLASFSERGQRRSVDAKGTVGTTN
jgi:hypothetical protein